MEPTRDIEKISSDLERYQIIKRYYEKNPERKKVNKSYLKEITLELVNISDMKLPKKLEKLCSELLDFFYSPPWYLNCD